MNPEAPTWQQNRAYMGELWPRWRLEPALSRLLDERWAGLHQDKLRECIKQHRMERDSTPDVSTIHDAYCRITGHGQEGRTAAQQTRRRLEETRGPSEADTAAWEREADAILATATPEEIKEAKAHYGIDAQTRRVLSLMVELRRKARGRR